jgi:hypothetical protein
MNDPLYLSESCESIYQLPATMASESHREFFCMSVSSDNDHMT